MTLTERYLRRLRFRLTLAYAVAMTVALGVLVVVVLRVDSELRYTAMSETLLTRAQEAAATVVYTDTGVNVDAFVTDDALTGGWPQVWLFTEEGGDVYPLAGPVDDWFGIDLAEAAAAAIDETPSGPVWVGETDTGSALYERAVPAVGPGDHQRVVGVAVVDERDFFEDHDRLRIWVLAAAAALVGAAAAAGYALAGRGTRATAAALAQQERLLADAAHELRTPVARIRAVAEGGMEGDEEPRAALARVARLGAEAGQMVDDMLTLARMDAGRETVMPEPLRLDLLVEEVAASFPGIEVQAVPTVVDGDAGLLRRAVSNLIRNAVTHGGGQVSVTVYPSRVIVRDQGSGLDPDVVPFLFERFHTGPTSAGHGLGLPMVAWIAEAHGGNVVVRDAAGGGVEAILEL